MKEYTIVEYEQSDFDAMKNGMTKEEAAEILASIPRGWFPYRLPEWEKNVSECDYENYRICCAIGIAVKALKERENNG